MSIKAYAAAGPGKPLKPIMVTPGTLSANDVEITVTHCGICHSDIHMLDNDWQMSAYPLVPGHEIIGTVSALGRQAGNLSKGQRVGVGWQSASCMKCEWCVRGEETSCPDLKAVIVGRHGGFAEKVRVDSRFAFPIPASLDSETAAPLLCAGITVFTPLKTLAYPPAKQSSQTAPETASETPKRVGVIGIGGLGHLAVQFAHAFGCEVTAFSTSPDKEKEARQLGARHFVVTSDKKQMQKYVRTLDVLLSAVTVDLDWDSWIKFLRPHGTLVIVGASPGALNVTPFSLIGGNKSVAGSMIGDRRVIVEMLEFAARHGIRAQTEIFPFARVNDAIRRIRGNQIRYRAVLTV